MGPYGPHYAAQSPQRGGECDDFRHLRKKTCEVYFVNQFPPQKGGNQIFFFFFFSSPPHFEESFETPPLEEKGGEKRKKENLPP